jgi:hypothetical protein
MGTVKVFVREYIQMTYILRNIIEVTHPFYDEAVMN